jgi:3-oxoacyl-[acyl-carrier-protein] synthase II
MSMSGVKNQPVAITGIGIVTALGVGKEDNWAKLTAGQSGIRRITRFPTTDLKTQIAAAIVWPGGEAFYGPDYCEAFADSAIREALAQSGIGAKGRFPGPLFLALPPLEMEWPQRQRLAAAANANDAVGYDDLLRAAASGQFRELDRWCQHGAVALKLQAAFGTRGSPISLNTACASGATALQLGVEAIRRGETEAALCVGTDSPVSPESLIRFSLLSALSTENDPPEQASKPFSKDRDGFVMGEGAAALVLESLASARARGARILGVISGIGESVDPFHRTRASPDGKPVAACIQNAIADAGLAPREIDYVNAHGTSTPENDKTEYLALSTVMGEHVKRVAVSSNKSMIGHTLSAAGAIEAVFTLLTLLHQRLPPTINYREPDPDIPLDVVPNTARDAQVRRALSNSFGFGGQNVSLVLETYG